MIFFAYIKKDLSSFSLRSLFLKFLHQCSTYPLTFYFFHNGNSCNLNLVRRLVCKQISDPSSGLLCHKTESCRLSERFQNRFSLHASEKL